MHEVVYYKLRAKYSRFLIDFGKYANLSELSNFTLNKGGSMILEESEKRR